VPRPTNTTPEHERLRPDAAAVGVDELRQQSQEEERGLRVQHVDDCPASEGAAQRFAPTAHLLDLVAAEQLANADVDQIGGAGVLDDVERQRGRNDQRGQPDRCRRHVHEGAEMDPCHGCQTDTPALLGALDDHVEHRRPWNDEERHRSEGENPQRA